MTTNPTEYHDLDAWFAGFLDGEGCIRIAIADRERYSTGFELAPMVRIAHEQLTGLLDADGWIGVTVRPEDGYKVNHRPQPQVEISQSSQDRLMDALCAYCDARDINCFVTTLEYDDDRADQYVWGVQGISTTQELLTPLRDQFIVKREQVDLFLDEIIPRLEDGVHHDKEGFLEVIHYVDRFNAYKSGSRGKYTLDYFEDLWEMEYTPE